MVRAADPLNVPPGAAPSPPLLSVMAAAVAFAVAAVVAVVALLAVPALPVTLMFQVPLALPPVVEGTPRLVRAPAASDAPVPPFATERSVPLHWSLLMVLAVARPPRPSAVRAPAALFAPVPPLTIATMPETLFAVTFQVPLTLLPSARASARPPTVAPSCTWIVSVLVLTVISPSTPVKLACWAVVPRLILTCLLML